MSDRTRNKVGSTGPFSIVEEEGNDGFGEKDAGNNPKDDAGVECRIIVKDGEEDGVNGRPDNSSDCLGTKDKVEA